MLELFSSLMHAFQSTLRKFYMELSEISKALPPFMNNFSLTREDCKQVPGT
jgi:hypothetical protein